MVIKITSYKCQECGNIFDTEKEAVTCAASHLRFMGLTDTQKELIAETLKRACQRESQCPIAPNTREGGFINVIKGKLCPFGVKKASECITLPQKEYWLSLLNSFSCYKKETS